MSGSRILTALRSRWAFLRRRPEHGGGGISLLVVVLIPAALLLVGLIVDGGGKARALSRADNIAEEAARAGTTGLSIAALGKGSTDVLDANAARVAAQNYLKRTGVPGTVTVENGNRLLVDVTVTEPTVFLSAIGVNNWTVTGHGTADLLRT